jgi:N-acetylmuramoyl-L-alanine amidase
MNLVISSGHALKVCGAAGPEPWGLDEVEEARLVVEAVADILLKHGIGVKTFHDDISETQNDNLEAIVDFHNQQERQLDVSVHFNCYTTTDKPMGTEVLYLTAADHAAHVVNAIAKAGFVNRGAKKREDLYFLNNTEMPAILIECLFVDSRADVELYGERFEALCKLIAASLVLTLTGRTMLPEVRDRKSIPTNQMNITASVFGGEDDYNVSAYDETKVLNDTDFYIALPDRFEGQRPTVRVYNDDNDRHETASVEDVGPWNTDDPYWITGARPQAESGTDMTGRETNGAGIDLSPALAQALGIAGLGKVHWKFE